MHLSGLIWSFLCTDLRLLTERSRRMLRYPPRLQFQVAFRLSYFIISYIRCRFICCRLPNYPKPSTILPLGGTIHRRPPLHQLFNIYLCNRNRYVLSVEDLYVAFPNMYVPADFVRIQVMLEFEYLRWLY
jgi:hypothetical protein